MQTQTIFRITEPIRKQIIKIVDERIREDYVTKGDFSELRSIVWSIGVEVEKLAEAQKKTEIKVEELAEAQKKTETKVEELAEAQKKTEEEIRTLAMELKETRRELKQDIKDTRIQLGGLEKSVSYGFENEAYRMLPLVLKERYNIQIDKKLIRVKMGEKEINIFGKGKMNGKEILIVGEAQLRLDEMRKGDKERIFQDLENKVEIVKKEYKQEIVRLLIAHFATPGFIKEAEGRGIIVIQSFEW
ncbi:MAG: hypothetical protein AB1422_15640 [bacterium]